MAGEPPEEITGYRHGRVPRAVRERQLLALAEELFAERGYAGTSMDEVAARAGVSKPVIYGLFGSKDGLYRRVFDRAADELERAVLAAAAGEGEIAARLEAGSLAFFRFIDQHRGAWARLLLEAGGPGAEHVGRIRARQTRLVAAILAEFVPGLDPLRLEAAANGLNGALEAMASWWRDHPEVTPERLTEWAMGLLLPGLRALAASGPRH